MPRSVRVLVLSLPALAALGGCRAEPTPHAEAPPHPVRTEEARLAPFAPRLSLFGVVEAGMSSEVLAPVGGVVRYPPRFPRGPRSGMEVAAGEALARIENEAVDLELREARLRFASARSELERHRRAFEAGVESEAQLEPWRVGAELAGERLRAAEQEKARLTLRAPTPGRLAVERSLPPGAEAREGAVLARIVGNGPPAIEALGSAEELELLEPGLPARIRLPGGEEPVAEAVVAEIPPALEDGGAARIGLDVVTDRGLPPVGAGVEAEISLSERGLALTVPEEAVQLARGGASLFVIGRKEGVGRPVAQRRAIRLGARGEGRVEVLEGVRPGDRVVVSGAGFLEDGQEVEEIRDSGAGVESGG